MGIVNEELWHHGIKGQKWGVRRFQNEDRTWTKAGKERYNDGPGEGESKKKDSGGSDKVSPSAKKSKEELTPEELAARAARRKEIAKDIAIGVGVAAAVVGAAYVAQYSGARISDLNAINSDQFHDRLASSLDQEFASLVKNKTEEAIDQGIIKKSKDGMQGVLQRAQKGSIYRSPEQLKVDIDFEQGKLDRNTKHLYTAINGAVDKIMADNLGIKDVVTTVGDTPVYQDRKIDVSQAKNTADRYIKTLYDLDSEYTHMPPDSKYLTDVAREYIRSFGHSELAHHGIFGMRWGVRRYQNKDGSLTEAGKRRLDKKDSKWAHKNEEKIYNQTYKKSRNEMDKYVKKLNKQISPTNKNGQLSATYMNAYNQKLAEVMNKNVKEIHAPSGKVVKWVAKRGDIGVHMALADEGYNFNQLKRGVYGSGRIAYRKNSVNVG